MTYLSLCLCEPIRIDAESAATRRLRGGGGDSDVAGTRRRLLGREETEEARGGEERDEDGGGAERAWLLSGRGRRLFDDLGLRVQYSSFVGGMRSCPSPLAPIVGPVGDLDGDLDDG